MGGFTNKTFTEAMKSVIKNTLVRLLSAVTEPGQVQNVHAVNVKATSGAMTEVDVKFALVIRLDVAVARSQNDDSRRLTTEYSGSAANLTNSFASDMSSATSSGNLTSTLTTEVAKSNATSVNVTVNTNATASATSSAKTSSIIVEYTRYAAPPFG